MVAQSPASFVESPGPAEAPHRPVSPEAPDLSLGPPGSCHTFWSPSSATHLAEVLPPVPSPPRTAVWVGGRCGCRFLSVRPGLVLLCCCALLLWRASQSLSLARSLPSFLFHIYQTDLFWVQGILWQLSLYHPPYPTWRRQHPGTWQGLFSTEPLDMQREGNCRELAAGVTVMGLFEETCDEPCGCGQSPWAVPAGVQHSAGGEDTLASWSCPLLSTTDL